MKIMIDTHVFLWAVFEPEKLSKSQISELNNLANTIYVSSITLVEIIIKNTIGKLEIDLNLVEIAENSGFELLDFNSQDALKLKEIPLHHKDPFDRMLIAQAISNSYFIMSDDKKFKHYECRLI